MAQLVSEELQYLILYKALESRQTGSIGPPKIAPAAFHARNTKEGNMGEIRGMAAMHWPLLTQPDETKGWPFWRTLARNPQVPGHLKDPSHWPAQAQ
jgi:hypothetical protein